MSDFLILHFFNEIELIINIKFLWDSSVPKEAWTVLFN
jgi:hypothetical protein